MTAYTTSWLNFSTASGWGTGSINATTFGSDYAMLSLNKNSTGPSLFVTGVTLPGTVGPNDTLIGIEFQFYGYANQSGVTDTLVRLRSAGTSLGVNKSSSEGWTGATRNYGGPGDLWGSGLTRSDLNSTFELELQQTSGDSSVTIYINSAQVRFTFEPPPSKVRAGGLLATKLYLGATPVTAAYLGATKVF